MKRIFQTLTNNFTKQKHLFTNFLCNKRVRHHSNLSYASKFLSDENKKHQTGPILKKPEEPDPNSCCGGQCVNCVWTVYFEQLQEYEEAMEKQAALQKEINNKLEVTSE